MNSKKKFSIIMSAVLLLTTIVVPFQEAKASSLRGVACEYDVGPGMSGDWTRFDLWGIDVDSISPKDFTGSADYYVPVSVLEDMEHSDLAGMTFGMVLIVYDKEKKIKYDIMLSSVSVHPDKNGNLGEFYHFNESTLKENYNINYVSSSMDGDYIKVSLKDVPVDTARPVYVFDEVNNKNYETTISNVPKKGRVSIGCTLNIWGTKKRITVKGAFSNISGRVGEEETKVDLSTKKNIGHFSTNKQDYDIGPCDFNTTMLSVAKNKATVSVGKSVKVKVTPSFIDDKVTVRSSNKKIATAKYSDGKVTIKGIKKGKATLTIKYNGVVKKIIVSVK